LLRVITFYVKFSKSSIIYRILIDNYLETIKRKDDIINDKDNKYLETIKKKDDIINEKDNRIYKANDEILEGNDGTAFCFIE